MPQSEWAAKSSLMAAYAHYMNKEYADSVFAIDRFISLHPADRAMMPYVLYLKGLCHFDRIDNVSLDQEPAQNTKRVFEELIKKFPNSTYSKDAKRKIIIAVL